MAKKSDLESLHNTYRMFSARAAAAVRSQALGPAINHALDSLEALPGYADYESRYAKAAQVATPTLDVIFAYAPALFRSDAVRQVATLLMQNPKLPKKLGRDLTLELQTCHRAMEVACRLWDCCSGRPPRRDDPSTSGHADPNGVLGVWTRLGLLASVAPAGQPMARFGVGLGGSFEGICPRCGARRVAPKLAMLSTLACDACAASVDHVIVRAADPEGHAPC